MAHQCFDTLNTYGKQPEQLENIIKMFVLSLHEYPLDAIKKSFVEWVKSNAEMPTPADILRLCDEIQARKNRAASPTGPFLPAPRIAARVVPWFGKMWGDFTDDDKRQLAVHLVNLKADRAEDYAKFLHDKAAAPKNLFHVLGLQFSEAA